MTKELQAIDHEVDGNTKRLWQYRGSPVFTAMLETFTEKINELEAEFTKFKNDLSIDTALGVNLDNLGDMLNPPYRPIDDEEYRNVLYALIAAYNSEGRASDIFDLLSKIVESTSIVIFDYGSAAFGAQINGLPALSEPEKNFLISAVNLAKAAGVRFEGIVVPDDPAGVNTQTFVFNEDLEQNGGGFLRTPDITGIPISEFTFTDEAGENIFTKDVLGVVSLVITQVNDSDVFYNKINSLLGQGQASHRNSISITDNFGDVWTWASTGKTGVVSQVSLGASYQVEIVLYDGTNFVADTFDFFNNRINNTGTLLLFETFNDEIDYDSNNPYGIYSVSSYAPPYYSFIWNSDNQPAGADRVKVISQGGTPYNPMYLRFYVKSSGQDGWRHTFQSELQALADTVDISIAPSEMVIWDRSGDKWILTSNGFGAEVTGNLEFSNYVYRLLIIDNNLQSQYSVTRNDVSVPTGDFGFFDSFEGNADVLEWSVQNGAGPQKQIQRVGDVDAGFISELITNGSGTFTQVLTI